MRPIATSRPYLCARCIRAKRASEYASIPLARRWSSNNTETPQSQDKTHDNDHSEDARGQKTKDVKKGAMSARLEQMSERSLESNPSGAAQAVADAGFCEDLRKQLEERIAGANFRNQNANLLARADMSESAPKLARDIAGARPWTGTENVEDASLRMLNDSYRPMRGSRSVSAPAMRMPTRVDTGRGRKIGAGSRIASAKENTAAYEQMNNMGLSEEEREKLRQEMRARFQPEGRTIVPGTINGIASLANKRIEDAIARGQFKNLPRGKKIERDYSASSPFIDTTEYFMNKIIQRQEIVPPWIEKQQELVSTANKFRQRLRNDWKRHASRSIASKGGSLEDQMQQARRYAEAELRSNPTVVKEERLNTIENDGNISQISLSGELRAPSPDTADSEAPVEKAAEEVLVTAQIVSPDSQPPEIPSPSSTPDTETPPPPTPTLTTDTVPQTQPFRDPAWLANEISYLRLAVENLNNLTRSYNLQAPPVAQRPYFTLERELRNCYADVAPQLAHAIRERALAPKARNIVLTGGKDDAGMLDRLVGTGTIVRVRDERGEKRYGFKQFWKDLFQKEEKL